MPLYHYVCRDCSEFTQWRAMRDAGGDPWLVWLGLNWLAWAVLWFLFFLLLALQRPITRLTGYVTALEGIFTAWLPAWLLFQGYLKM